MRINARLDKEHSEKLEQLRKQLKLSISDVVKEAIDIMYEKSHLQAEKKIQSLVTSGFVGCAEGPEDLASNYKQYSLQDLNAKHDTQ